MKVFKFGGASVKDAPAVKNMAEIVGKFSDDQLVIIVSAMGKTTNALEKLVNAYLADKDWKTTLNDIKEYHIKVARGLFREDHVIFDRIDAIFDSISNYLNESSDRSHMEIYSEIVGQGELLSTRIVRNYLNENIRPTRWIDAREFIKTDYNFIDARVDWEITSHLIYDRVRKYARDSIVLTQGFIGSDNAGKTTTLGREGSDFSAAIFATCLKADSLTVWKDVAGILTADPRVMPDAEIIEKLTYTEASEMTYYGARVIHPRTIKPLAQNNIKLYVRPFTDPEQIGTVVGEETTSRHPASFIVKKNQVLLSLKVRDFSHIDEKRLGLIFHELDRLNIKINLMQNSAISFSICIDKKFDKVERLKKNLEEHFDIGYHENLELITIKNYDEHSFDKIGPGINVLMEQKTKNNWYLLHSRNLS